jgi:pyruvate carboxylase
MNSVAMKYREVNMMFGDIVKVTPSSKVVGDMALMMVSQGHTQADVEDPAIDVAFPDSVEQCFAAISGNRREAGPRPFSQRCSKGLRPSLAGRGHF